MKYMHFVTKKCILSHRGFIFYFFLYTNKKREKEICNAMIEKAACSLAHYFLKKGVYNLNDIPVYTYGFELLVSTVMNLVCLLCLAALTSTVFGAVLFCAAFIPLRMIAGGYHAHHHWSCILIFNVTYVGAVVLSDFLNTENLLVYLLISTVLSISTVWMLAPVEARNKPLSAKQRALQRERSKKICWLNLLVMCVVLFFEGKNLIYWMSFYFSGALAASGSLIAARLLD